MQHLHSSGESWYCNHLLGEPVPKMTFMQSVITKNTQSTEIKNICLTTSVWFLFS